MIHVNDIAKKHHCSTGAVLRAAKKYNVPYIVKSDAGRYSLFDEDAAQFVSDVLAGRKAEMYVEKICEDKHPLVTDKRCLDFNYWPDVVPIVFQHEDEDE